MTDASLEQTPAPVPGQAPSPTSGPPDSRPVPRRRSRGLAAPASPGCSTRPRRRRPLDGARAEAALRRHLEGGLEVDALYLREQRDLGVPSAMPFTAVARCATQHPVRTSASGTTTRRRRHATPRARRPRTRRHVGVAGVGRRRPRRGDLPEALADVRLDLAPVVVSSFTDRRRRPGPARPRRRARVGPRRPRTRPVRCRRSGRTDPDLAPLADLVHKCRPLDSSRTVTVDATVLHAAARHRRRRPRRRGRHRGRVPAPPRGGGRPRRRGVRADRPAPRGHRRPVPHRRGAAGRPSGLGPRRRGLWVVGTGGACAPTR